MQGDGSLSLEEVTRRTREAGQWGFWKVPFTVAGPDDDIPFPRRCTYFDYEGEAAIVIGRQGKDVKGSRLKDHVWGVTLFDDWSIRDGMGSPRPMSYNLPKNFDGSTSMGPCIVVGELDPQDVDVEVRINGEIRQQYNTRDMVFSFAEVLEELSRDFTFVPGDVISGGTSSGTAQDSTPRGADGKRSLDRFLKVGDVVELSSPQIGVLRNRIVKA
jgi:2-keto-4-pentenoate hydratase/2-oxohepta-3-ene-1,7-dioic acid hydratase in catechol pathway